MSSNIEDHIKRLREERAAREQARLQKLRELNKKRYSKSDYPNATNQLPIKKKTPSAPPTNTGAIPKNVEVNKIKNVKSSVSANYASRRPVTVPIVKKPQYVSKLTTKSDTKVQAKTINRNVTVRGKDAIPGNVKKSPTKLTKNINNEPSTSNFDISKPDVIITKTTDNDAKAVAGNALKTDTKMTTNNVNDIKTTTNDAISKPDIIITTETDSTNKSANEKKVLAEITKKATINSKLFKKNYVESRKSYSQGSTSNHELCKPKNLTRRSMLPKVVEGTKSESVFDRLYKPKITKKPDQKISEAEKLRTDPHYLKKVIRNTDLVYNTHQPRKSEVGFAQRRSISAVHFKRINKSELGNCMHKWGSIGEKLDKVDLNEDVPTKFEKVTSSIKSERKKVKFMTPSFLNLNTPKPEELQARLKAWLQKRGKSLSSYHHLQCFGLHLKPGFGTPKSKSSVAYEDALESPRFDDENKENISLQSDSDDGSYSEMMNEPKEVAAGNKDVTNKIDVTNWRNVSLASESVFNESNVSHKFDDSTLTPAELVTNIDDLLYGALNDLSTLLREGFDWQQAARWLRSIRGRFPSAPRTAAYWECRAALEDSRGNLTASLECWNEAIAKGAEESVVDSNLDQLLNKFMQLKISPQSGAAKQADPKLVDVKNVFKSTIIKFAVQQAKLRNISNTPTPLFTVTPVRRSARLSHCISRTPLRLCDTVRQAATVAPEHIFTPNDNFVHTP